MGDVDHGLAYVECGTKSLIEAALVARSGDLSATVRQLAIRHLIDTVGAIVAGSRTPISSSARESASTQRNGVNVIGTAQQCPELDAAWLGGIAGHSLEFDDGHTGGSVHPGVCVIPAAFAVAQASSCSGDRLLRAIVCGYELTARAAAGGHPAVRRSGFHPTGVFGPFGASIAAGVVIGLSDDEHLDAVGLAASSSAGLFAFLGGGADVISEGAFRVKGVSP